MMRQYLIGIVLLSVACLSIAFKEEDCEGNDSSITIDFAIMSESIIH